MHCCTSWFHGLPKYHQQKLQIFQNKMIRYIMHLGPRDHVGQDQFESVKLLDTQNRSRQLRLNHMFNIFHSLGPSYFNQFFTQISDIHSHATRSSSFNFHLPRIGSYAKHSFFYQATLDWNNLPSHIKSISDKCSFKSTMKKHLARNARVIHESADIA